MASGELLNKITQRGIDASFRQALQEYPSIHENHCQIVNSTAETHTYAFLGSLPQPRVMLGNRQFQGMRDFSFTATDDEVELSIIIDRKTMEDDQAGQVEERIQDMGTAWAAYWDSVFVLYLTEGDGTTYGGSAFDAVAFHGTTRTIGDSAAIANLQSDSAPSTATKPTPAELLNSVSQCIGAMIRFQDDQGTAGTMTAGAMSRLRIIAPPEFQKSFIEATQAEMIAQTSNAWGGSLPIEAIDSSPFMPATSTDATFYMSAVGAKRRPFIKQVRNPLEVVVLNGRDDVAQNNGVKILTRQRATFAYGDPRLNIRCNLS